jgi:hypothetical protein
MINQIRPSFTKIQDNPNYAIIGRKPTRHTLLNKNSADLGLLKLIVLINAKWATFYQLPGPSF